MGIRRRAEQTLALARRALQTGGVLTADDIPVNTVPKAQARVVPVPESETYPRCIVMGEQAPGSGWQQATPRRRPAPATPPTPSTPPGAGRRQPAVEPSRIGLSDLLAAMSTALAAQPLQETPFEAFLRLAELRAKAEGITYSEACSRQGTSTPELWQAVRDDQPRY